MNTILTFKEGQGIYKISHNEETGKYHLHSTTIIAMSYMNFVDNKSNEISEDAYMAFVAAYNTGKREVLDEVRSVVLKEYPEEKC